MKLFVVRGGVGKHAIFSGLISHLVKKYKSNISVMSAYPDIFKYHPNVDMSVIFEEPGFYDEYIKKASTKIYYEEPYYSNYVKGKTHIATEWAKLFNIKNLKKINLLPDIYIDDFAVEEAKRFTKNHKEFIIVQFSGGQSPINIKSNKYQHNNRQIRDYPREEAQKLINKIKEKYPQLTILNFVLPNEQTAKLDNTISIQAPYLFYVALCQLSLGYICIDSSLQHFAANRYNEKIGIVLWGSTGSKQLGYEKNYNYSKRSDKYNISPLTRPMGDIFDKDGSPLIYMINMKFDIDELMDAVNMMIVKNRSIKSTINNFIVDTEREEKEIILKPEMSQLLLSLTAQSQGLQQQVQNLINQIIDEEGKKGNFVLSKGATKLLRV